MEAGAAQFGQLPGQPLSLVSLRFCMQDSRIHVSRWCALTLSLFAVISIVGLSVYRVAAGSRLETAQSSRRSVDRRQCAFMVFDHPSAVATFCIVQHDGVSPGKH